MSKIGHPPPGELRPPIQAPLADPLHRTKIAVGAAL